MDATDSGAGEFRDFSDVELKSDHRSRPIWVTNDGLIILEAFSPIYQQAYDFLVAIAEPVSRPEFIHKYQLTTNSLYAAVSVSIETESIIDVLRRLCKTELPEQVVSFIRERTATFGKAKLVLKDNQFFVESSHPDVLRELLRYKVISNARIYEQKEPSESEIISAGSKKASEFLVTTALPELKQNMEYINLGRQAASAAIEDDEDDFDEDVRAGTLPGQVLQKVSFMISQDQVQEVKRCALNANYPLMEEYDFKCDHRNPSLSMDLKPSTRIRTYQEKSLSKMFGNGRARSGIIVLPCGAGKSLTGVTAATTVKKSTMILCINNVSVRQWKSEFLNWTTVNERSIKMFTAEAKEPLPPPSEPCIVLTTYSMLCYSGQRAEEAVPIIASIKDREWGLIILDEVHVAPASKFRTVLNIINSHCKLGLTATLVREDNLIDDLHFLIGPKLYEANWMDLTQQGYLANVQCAEVWCPMTAEFYREYLKPELSMRQKQLLYILNPRKFRMCEYLVKFHEERGDKIIIFSDDVFALQMYARALKRPYIYGGTPDAERNEVLALFKTSTECNCIGLSKVGDTALDIPEANVIVQVSSHFGGRRQEAQRLGRILRPKQNQSTGTFNAFFYTLISTDTREMYYSAKRQQYLVDQGYTFKVIEDLVDISDNESTLLKSKEQECDLLTRILRAQPDKSDADEEKVIKNSVNEGFDDPNYVPGGIPNADEDVARDSVLLVNRGKSFVQNLSRPGADVTFATPAISGRGAGRSSLAGIKRKVSSLAGLSGVDGSSYEEFDSTTHNRGFKGKGR